MTTEFSLTPLSQTSTNTANPNLGTMSTIALSVQVGVLLVSGIVLLVLAQSAALSFIVGGLSSMVPQIVVTLLMRRARSDGSKPLQFLKLLYVSEFIKILATVLILVVSLSSGLFTPILLLAGFLGLMVSAWIGLAIAAFWRPGHGS